MAALPLDRVEEAKAWRDKNVEPYLKWYPIRYPWTLFRGQG